MKQVRLPLGMNYYKEVMAEFKEQAIKHTYFSGMRIIAFENDEDATAFVLQYGGTITSVIGALNKPYVKRLDVWSP